MISHLEDSYVGFAWRQVTGSIGPIGPAEMHIPDGFLSTPTSLILWVVAAMVIAAALARVNRDMDERRVPLMGVTAAVIFAGQMLNFTVTGGTSGHLLGAAIATALLGPWAAIIAMTCVVGTQAILFQDGGLLALGANLVNMAIIGVVVALGVLTLVRRLLGAQRIGQLVSGFLAGWCSIFVTSLACALQLALSGTSPANLAVPAMGGIHALIGVGEGLITAAALGLVYAARGDLLEKVETGAAGRALAIGGLVTAVLLAVLSPLASARPDGLEWVAEQQGFLGRALEAPFRLIGDYVFPGIANQRLATIVAGIVGVVVVLVATWLVSSARRRESGRRT
jgi:cobalt/nickel transport system permease protein